MVCSTLTPASSFRSLSLSNTIQREIGQPSATSAEEKSPDFEKARDVFRHSNLENGSSRPIAPFRLTRIDSIHAEAEHAGNHEAEDGSDDRASYGQPSADQSDDKNEFGDVGELHLATVPT